MRVVADIETNALDNPSCIWCVCAIDVDTGKEYSFDLTNKDQAAEMRDWAKSVKHWIGHNFISYDAPQLQRLAGIFIDTGCITDTLVLSHLLKYKLDDGHSLEAWGERLGIAKVGLDVDFTDQSSLHSIIERCRTDVKINLKLYEYLMSKLDRKEFHEAIKTEMDFAFVCLDMHENGFAFDIDNAKTIYSEVEIEVNKLDLAIKAAFPPRAKAVREITPRLTKHGTISRANIPRDWVDFTVLSPDCPFTLITWEEFNPGSTRQIIERLSPYWDPVDRTDGYLKAQKARDKVKIAKLDKTAWKVSESNLATLKENAPDAARLLVRRLMLGARLRTLTEWIASCRIKIQIKRELLNDVGMSPTETTIKTTIEPNDIILERSDNKITSVNTELLLKTMIECLQNKTQNVLSADELRSCMSITATQEVKFEGFSVSTAMVILDGLKSIIKQSSLTTRVHGTFKGMGTWTHRMSHVKPNLGNVAAEKSIKYNSPDLKSEATKLGGRMRSLWCTSKGSLLVGTDMESAHLRIFAHLINDPKFTEALLKGDKKLGTDPHSVNAKLLSSIGADRDRAKTFIFTFLNGGGTGKVASIFGTSTTKAKEALGFFIESYPGLKRFKEKDAEAWARRGYFIGPDGRFVVCDSAHHMLAGYLQNYEATMMKKANLIWRAKADELGIQYKQVNLVHDEFVTEVQGTEEDARTLGKLQADAIRQVGEMYGLRCPLAGEYKIGNTWLEVH